jgi:hypothetical protein
MIPAVAAAINTTAKASLQNRTIIGACDAAEDAIIAPTSCLGSDWGRRMSVSIVMFAFHSLRGSGAHHA